MSAATQIIWLIESSYNSNLFLHKYSQHYSRNKLYARK